MFALVRDFIATKIAAVQLLDNLEYQILVGRFDFFKQTFLRNFLLGYKDPVAIWDT